MSHSKLSVGAVFALVCLTTFPLLGADEGRFSVAVGSHDDLVISNPGGGAIADVDAQTVGQSVTLGNSTVQVSYGRDANGQLTAVLASPDLSTVALHFSAGGKSIDADKAVVTLTFSPNLKGVLVDPGYVGTVEVDSHVLRAHSLADDLPIAAALAAAPSDVVMPNLAPSNAAASVPATTVASDPTPAMLDQSSAPIPSPDTSVAQTIPEPARGDDRASTEKSMPAPGSTSLADSAARPESVPTAGGDLPTVSAPLASQLAPILPPTSVSASTSAAAGTYVSVRDRMNADQAVGKTPGQLTQEKLFWSEPVTAPDGTAPSVAQDEIRLVEIHGTVTITAPGGTAQAGTEGMLVPSGATVQTADNSSAALFMGGVNSARLMPNCELTVTQALAGSTRTDVINLQAGAVFSRIGHREGETESFSITTPEGSSSAETNDMMAFRGTPDDLRSSPITRTGLNLGTHLLAWNPAPTHGLISDVPGWDMGMIDSKKKSDTCSYFYYCQSAGSVQSEDIRHEVLTCEDKDRDRDNHDHQRSDCQPQYVLQQVLETLQPYNTKLKEVLANIDSGTATSAELAFYHKLIGVFFCLQEPGIVSEFEKDKKKFDQSISGDDKVLTQDLNEFGLPSLTPH